MSFSWSNVLEFAKELHSEDSQYSEAKHRSVISRSYFSAHCMGREFFKQQSRLPTLDSGAVAHKQLISQLRNHWKEEYKQAGEELDRLRDWRNDSDYDKDTDFDVESQADASVRKAEKVRKTFESES